jgi:hypothetical protein
MTVEGHVQSFLAAPLSLMTMFMRKLDIRIAQEQLLPAT